ncbi:MAG: sulfatase [Acidobacteria bacterium]|nr:sulfatase [Acidobacteriota bacterium]
MQMKKLLSILTVSILISLLILLTLILPSCGKEKEQHGVILIVLDALRRDHLSGYGYERNTSPFLDSLSRQSTFFSNAFSAAPQTVPSVGSLMTGLYPYRHGSHFFSNIQSYHPTKEVIDGGLPNMKKENTLISEVFQENGFYTAMITSNPGILDAYGYAQGYDYYKYVNCWRENATRVCDGARINQVFRDEVIPEISGEDFFVYLHYMDVHSPYFKPNSYKERFDKYQGEAFYRNGKVDQIRPDVLEYSIACYDEGIIYLDSLLEDLYKELEKNKLKDNTTVIIVSDHGDEFLEHRGMGHGTTCYNELINSFVLIYNSKIAPVRIDIPVSLVDIMPTLIDQFNLKIDDYKPDGISLVPIIQGKENTRQVFLAELGDRKTIIRNNMKYIFNLDNDTIEVYNLDEDPLELKKLDVNKAAHINAIKKIMDDIVKRMKISYSSKSLNREELENLRSLSYIN